MSQRSSSSNTVVVVAVVGSCLFCMLLFFALIIVVCRRATSRREPQVLVAIAPAGLGLKPKDETRELLRQAFPLQRYIALIDPVCSSCAVCQEQFSKSSEVQTLTCRHTYHGYCLERLFANSRKCAVCNREYNDSELSSRTIATLVTVAFTEPRENLTQFPEDAGVEDRSLNDA